MLKIAGNSLYLLIYGYALLNSKFLFILLINFAALVLVIALFVDRDRVAVVTDDVLTIIENKIQSATTGVQVAPQFSPVAPLPFLIVKKESKKAIKQLLQEKQKGAEEGALLQAQWVLSQQQNKRLEAQIKELEEALETQHNYITSFGANDFKPQHNRADAAALMASDSDLLRTAIQSQPDFIDRKVEKETQEGDEDVQGLAEQADNFSGSVEFGFSYKQDNKVTRAVNGRLILDYEELSEYKVNSNFKFEKAGENRQKSIDKYRWELQGDYYLDPYNLAFARSDMNRSQFASYEKEDTYTAGYGRILFAESKHTFNIEFGPGYRIVVPNDTAKGLPVDELIIHTRLNYERVISESLQMVVNTSWGLGRENSIYILNIKAQNKIYRELYLIFDFEYKFTQNVPVSTLNEEVSTSTKLLYAF